MRELNLSYRSACLHCSFSDKELNEYIQEKKRAIEELPIKRAVTHVGRQPDDTWVLGEHGCISRDGELIPMESSSHIWIGHLYKGVGLASTAKCQMETPFSTDPLRNVLLTLRDITQQNYVPSILLIAGILLLWNCN